MTTSIDRRSFLKYVGAHTAATAALLDPLARSVQAATMRAPSLWVDADGAPAWTPVGYPVPTPGDGGIAANDPTRFARYGARDTLVLPEGFRFDVVAAWGDRFGPDSHTITFGHNCDFTGLVPVRERPGRFWLLVNHEYVSARPWLQGYERAHGVKLPTVRFTPDGGLEVDGHALSRAEIDLLAEDPSVPAEARDALRRMCRAGMDDLGVSILEVRQNERGAIEVVRDSPHHVRISGLHPEGATFGNCGGTTTPWGTFPYVRGELPGSGHRRRRRRGGRAARRGTEVQGERHAPAGSPSLRIPRSRAGPAHDGRDFGWVCEVQPTGRLKKQKSLGRLRHENVALRAEQGHSLAAYMGDDRRGGHIWKFVSQDVVAAPSSPDSRRLFDNGTLHVARWHGEYTGRWIALIPDTPLAVPEPAQTAMGHVWLPDRRTRDDGRPGGRVAVGAGQRAEMTVDQWIKSIERFAGRPFAELTLGDLVDGDRAREIILLDAFLMANAAGGTPTSRPEAIQIHPKDRSVYIAFTDNTGGSDGSPDVRIFPDSRGENSRQYGAIYRLEEDGGDPAAQTFRWGQFVSSGEMAEQGGGFACADNLVFDPDGNMWMVCDVSTGAHNYPVTRESSSTKPGATLFRGIFGNNALFMIPTRGAHVGVPHCFAIGPMECELTGPTFTPDGRALILSVQHPGEQNGTRGGTPRMPLEETRTLTLAARDGRMFRQERVVPLGSNFPSTELGTPPLPTVVCITRA